MSYIPVSQSNMEEVRAVLQSRDLKVGPDTEGMEECCSLACSPHGWLSPRVSYTAQAQLPMGDSTHSNHLSLIINQEDALPVTCIQRI